MAQITPSAVSPCHLITDNHRGEPAISGRTHDTSTRFCALLSTYRALSCQGLFLNCGPCCGSPNGLSYTTSFLYRFPKSSWLEHICSACKRPTSNTQQPLLRPQESYNQRLRYFTKVPAHHSVWGPQEPNLKKKVRPKKKNWSKLYMFGMYRPWVQKRKEEKKGKKRGTQ